MKTFFRHTIHAAILLAAASVVLAGCENLLGGGSNGGDSGNSENDDGSGGGDTVPFITTWQTDASGDDLASGNEQVHLPLDPDGSYDFTVEWGDGTQDHITAWDQAERLHTYPSAGFYDVTISGQIDGFGFGNTFGVSTDADKLVDVKQWGTVALRDDGGQFMDANNLSGFSAADAPDLSGVTDLSRMFEGADTFDGDIGGWDTSAVTNMSYMFLTGLAFNQDLSGWCVSYISSEPDGFATSSPLDATPENKPDWGTCP